MFHRIGRQLHCPVVPMIIFEQFSHIALGQFFLSMLLKSIDLKYRHFFINQNIFNNAILTLVTNLAEIYLFKLKGHA